MPTTTARYQQAEVLLKTIETAEAAVCIASQDATILYTSPAMEELSGCGRGELVGRSASIPRRALPATQEVRGQKSEVRRSRYT